ncbi:MAG: phenylalanine--tRNA ligase subunit alpha [bacterium]|nr:phenylalanine--tRNA ligase subunit alpha [bacterium]
MKEKLAELARTAVERVAEAADLKALEDLRVKYLGRKGMLTEVLRGLSDAPPEERPALGQAANKLKNLLAKAVEERKSLLGEADSARKAEEDTIDLSLPGRRPRVGHMHPVAQVTEEIVSIFSELGFQVATGPDIETEYYNFDCLNTPDDHPARDLHDTFFVKPGVVLRTHTSPVQMRVMEKTQPPVAVIVPGRVYRVDADSTHSPMFFQLEGLLVDKDVTFAELKGTLMHFVHKMFGPDIPVRFRPHYFPFTEPSAEMDILWSVDRGNGQKEERWLEIGGCGMVHPEVFKYAKYDSTQYTGFAFGMGMDRIAMVKYGIDSISHLYENDLRFLEQF